MTMADPANPLLDAAHAWHTAGFCVIPSHEDGSKRPFRQWKEYQTTRPDWPTLERWLLTGRYTGIGLIMGQASGNAEMIEIEGPDLHVRLGTLYDYAKTLDDKDDLGATDLVSRTYNGCSELSGGNGLHIFVKVTDGPVPGNQKLASTDNKVITETRGEGGFVIVWPTPARHGHDDGAVYMLLPDTSPDNTAQVTSEELDLLHFVFGQAFGGLNDTTTAPTPRHTTAPTPRHTTTPQPTMTGLSPLDDYRQRTTWRDILEPAGWTHHSEDNEHDYWTRPGKPTGEGHSASTIEDGPFYLFSTSVPNIPHQVGLSKGDIYAHLHHQGDLSTATTALRDKGYGDTHNTLTNWNPAAAISDTFWTAHPTLTTIRQAAHSRTVSADAVLASILARVVQHIPYQYTIPPIVGGKSSPNLYVALIGPSGTGKGGARRAADELLAITKQPHPMNEGPLGSGEGIVSLFYGNPPKNPDNAEDTKLSKDLEFMYRGVMVLDEEGSALAELLKRQGQILEPILLKMWSGEGLGMSYSLRSSAIQLKVPAEEYRAAALLGIQPGAAAFLLDDARIDRGLPQRFLWASTIDPNIPDRRTPFPTPLNWAPPRFDHRSLTGTSIEVHDDIQNELIQAQLARARGQSEGVESHGGLVRLKAACALAALLHPGEPLTVNLDTWELAGQLKDASDKVRAAVGHKAKEEREKLHQARQDVAVRQRVAVGQVDSHVKNVARIIQRHIEKHHTAEGDYCKPSCARRSLKSKDRDLFDAAIAKALDLEWVGDNSQETDETPHFIVGPSRPA